MNGADADDKPTVSLKETFSGLSQDVRPIDKPPETRYRKTQWSNRPLKYKYHSPDGKRLAAGGIMFYDTIDGEKGLWLIEESEIGMHIYTDFGGKYDHNDGDINATICREFREESYNTAEIPYSVIRQIPEGYRIYIDGYDKRPVYVCVLMDMKRAGIRFDSDMITRQKDIILKCNPQIPERWYRTLDVRFVTMKDLIDQKVRTSGRLYALLTVLSENLHKYDEEVIRFFGEYFM